jgi:hypothetical protein
VKGKSEERGKERGARSEERGVRSKEEKNKGSAKREAMRLTPINPSLPRK